MKGPPPKNYTLLFYYFAEKHWLPMADIIVVGYGNGVQLFQRKTIIDIDKANYHSVTALLSLHIQQFTYIYQLAIVQYRDAVLQAPTRNVFMKHPQKYCYVLNCLRVNIHISVFETS